LRDMLQKIEAQYGKANRIWVMDRGIPTEEVLAEMRAADPPAPLHASAGLLLGQACAYPEDQSGSVIARPDGKPLPAAASLSSRFSKPLTGRSDQNLRPRAVGMPRAVRAAAIA
jgi:hypothetical protein